MRILHYTPTYAPAWSWGGPVVSTSALCGGLANAGHDVAVFTTDAGLSSDYRDRRAMVDGVDVSYFPTERGIGIASSTLEAAVWKHVSRFELVHVTAVWQRTGAAACRAACAAGVPYVVSPRGALGWYSWRRKTIKKIAYYLWRERRNLREAAGFHFTSAMEARECGRWCRRKATAIIPNPVLPPGWTRDPTAAEHWRAQQGISRYEPLLLAVGRVHHKKGFDLLPDALAAIATKPWRLIFVGPDEDGTSEQLRVSFAQRGLLERVHFAPLEPRENLPAVYSAGTMLLLPSRHENFGNAVVEALGCGCAVTISDQVGCAEEALGSGAATILPRRAEAWSVWLGRVLDKTDRLPPPEETVAWARNRFSRDALVSQLVAFYRRLTQCLPPRNF